MKNLTFEELEKFVKDHASHMNVSATFLDENGQEKQVCILNNGMMYDSFGHNGKLGNAYDSAKHVVEFIEKFGRKLAEKNVIKMYSDAFNFSGKYKISY